MGVIIGIIEGVIGIWESIKEIRVIGRIVKGLVCLTEWYAYINLIKGIIAMLKDIEMPDGAIMELLGLNAIFSAKNLKHTQEKIAKHLAQMEPTIQNGRELTERAKMAKSPWAGTHKPPYNSIAISEVLYDFSNVAGTGTMIIMFNPEGFGHKPKAPQIVRYVDEAEFAEFINSRSWGEYWRVNYLLGRRKRNKNRRAKNTKDIQTGEEGPLPKSEGLDDYMERVLELPDFADDLVASEFSDLIEQGINKSIDQTELMSNAIQQGSIGRGIEKDGLRITSMLQDKIMEVPDNLKQLITNNPIFKDVGKVTGNYKKFLTRVRSLRDSWSNAMFQNSLSKEALIASSNFGAITTINAKMALASNGAIIMGVEGPKIAGDASALVAKDATPLMFQYYNVSQNTIASKAEIAEAWQKAEDSTKGLQDAIANASSAEEAFALQGMLDSEMDFAGMLQSGLLEELGIQEDILKQALASFKEGLAELPFEMLKPPLCVPFVYG